MITRYYTYILMLIMTAHGLYGMASDEQAQSKITDQEIINILMEELEMGREADMHTSAYFQQNPTTTMPDMQSSMQSESSEKKSKQFNSGCPTGDPSYTPEIFETVIDYSLQTDAERELTEEEQSILKSCPQHLKDCILAFKNIDEEDVSKMPKNLVLVGETGLGKSTLARIIAKIAKRKFIKIRTGLLSNVWQGSENNNLAKTILPHINSQEKVILLFDEIDAITHRSDNTQRNADAAKILGQCMDDNKNPNLLIIGTCNSMECFDDALIYRLDDIITMQAPNLEQRKQILKIYLCKRNITFDKDTLEYAAERSDNLLSRSLVKMCERIDRFIMLEKISDKNRPQNSHSKLTQKHIDDAIKLHYENLQSAGIPRDAFRREARRIMRSPNFYPNANLTTTVIGSLIAGGSLVTAIYFGREQLAIARETQKWNWIYGAVGAGASGLGALLNLINTGINIEQWLNRGGRPMIPSVAPPFGGAL